MPDTFLERPLNTFGQKSYEKTEGDNSSLSTRSDVADSPSKVLMAEGVSDNSPFSTPFEVADGPSKVLRKEGSNVLTLRGLARGLVEFEYPVRGKIAELSESLTHQLQLNPDRFTSFNKVIPANIGNPQAVGRKPVTFNRQVMACLLNPTFIQDHSFPNDVRARASRYLKGFPSFGAYSESRGCSVFRRDIAAWFGQRDGFKCDPESIFLTNGASPAIVYALELLISDCSSGILLPIPQYPLYSATTTKLGGKVVGYSLDEDSRWGLTVSELQRVVDEARDKNIICKALVVINPNNPTGSLLRRDGMIEIIRFCERESLVLLADEVYQDNVYCDDAVFISFRHLVKTFGSPVELFSFHSASKTFPGECGFRGGFMQLENIELDVLNILDKMLSTSLCSNTIGQAMVACILNPPSPNDPSYELYCEEAGGIYNSLKQRALYTSRKLNQIEGISCQFIDSSLYAFPKITIPQKAIEVATENGVAPDMLYCMELLQETGIACVPGSGFHQKPGTFHIRLTILPDSLNSMLEELHKFNINFLEKYSRTADQNSDKKVDC